MRGQGEGGPAISHIIIDGYNVLGILHGNMEKVREEFVGLLIRYRAVRGHEITLVFDGYRNGPGREQSSVRGGVRIIYTALAEKADDAIKRIITGTRREWIVVSSDREVERHAWAAGSIPVPSEAFFTAVTRWTKNGPEGGPEQDREDIDSRDDDDLSSTRQQHGNPHRLSQKERAVRRALGKL